MSEEIEHIPFNKVGTKSAESIAEVAQNEGISEAEWRAQNLPAEKLEFRWRYDDKTIPLYERRLRSLGLFNIGPAVRAWVRSRLEWVRDNKLYDLPSGVIVLSIDPEGMVDIQLEEQVSAPALDANNAPGTLWHAKNGALYVDEVPKHAADTLVRDLANTLGWELIVDEGAPADAEALSVSDEFGVIAPEGSTDEMTKKLVECFDKLWTLNT